MRQDSSRCECGDTECPSCGTAQGTYRQRVSQICVRLPAYTGRAAREAAAQAGVTLSVWIRGLIDEAVGERSGEPSGPPSCDVCRDTGHVDDHECPGCRGSIWTALAKRHRYG